MAVLRDGRRTVKKSVILTLMAITALFSTSCGDLMNPNFDEPVREFFEKYTDSAMIDHHTMASYPQNSMGITCIPCNEDCVIEFYLINPQLYTLTPIFTFKDGTSFTPGTDLTFVQNANDKSKLKLTFKQSFIQSRDSTLDHKDISGTVSMRESLSGRVFESYPVNLHANTLPPYPQGAVVLVTTAEPKKYVLCFNMPSKNDIKDIHRDIKTLRIESNGSVKNRWIFLTTDSSGNLSYAADEIGTTPTNFKTSVLSGEITENTDTDAAGLGFTAEENPVYIFTNDNLVPITSNIYYKIIIEDEEGLSSSATTSVYSQKIDMPKASAVSNAEHERVEIVNDADTAATEIVQNEDGAGYVKLILPTVSTTGLSVSSCTVDYEIYGGASFTTLLGKGSINSTKEIPLPPVECKIKAYARNPAYVSSDFATFHVKPVCTKIYVDASGSESGWGTKSRPLNKISKVLEEDLFTDKTNSENTIVLLSDLEDGGISLSEKYCFTLTSQDSGGKAQTHTITPSASGSNFMSLAASSEIAIENTCISGFTGGAFAVADASLTLTDVEVSSNSSSANGGAFYLSNKDSSVTLCGRTVVKSNTAASGNGAYVGNKEAVLSINDASYFDQQDDVYLCADAVLYANASCTAPKIACLRPASYPEDPVVDKVKLLELTVNAINYSIDAEACSTFCNSRVSVAKNPADPDLEYYVVYSDFYRAGILAKGTSANVKTKLPDKVIFRQLYHRGIYLTFYATDGSGNRLSPQQSSVKVKLRSDVLSSGTKENGYVKHTIPSAIENMMDEDCKIDGEQVSVELSIRVSGIVYSATEDIVASSEIEDASTFANVVDFINTLDDSSDQTIDLVADIEVTDNTPLLGTAEHKFNGTFDGHGHTITLNRSGKNRMAAIADYVGPNGVIKNVVIDGSYRNEPSGNNSLISAGVAVENDGLIINCVNYLNLTVKSTNDTGGIVGVNRGKVVNCANFGNISNERSASWAMLCGVFGGIAGRSDGSSIIENCFNCGTIKSTKTSSMSSAPNNLPAAITGNQATNASGYNCYWKDGCVIRNCGSEGAAYNSYTFKNSVLSLFWSYDTIPGNTNAALDLSSKHGESQIYSCGTFSSSSSEIVPGTEQNSERAQTLQYTGNLLEAMNAYVNGKSNKYNFNGTDIDLLEWEADSAHSGYPKLKFSNP